MNRKILIIFYLVIIIGIFLTTTTYIKTSKPTFEITSEIMINRQTIALPEYLGEVGSNRWIWVRNGLATKESIITDSFLIRAIKELPSLVDVELSLDKKLQELRKNIKVDFKGADVYSFLIRVKSKHPMNAIQISNMIINEIKRIEIAYPIEVYDQTSQALQNDVESLKIREKNLPQNLESSKRIRISLNKQINQIESTLHQLKIARLLMSSEGENRFTLIKKPLIPSDPIWPKPLLLYVIATLLSLLMLLIIEVYRRNSQNKLKR